MNNSREDLDVLELDAESLLALLAALKGPAFLLYWSWDFNGSWTPLQHPATWWELLSTRVRWGRLGEPVH